MAAIPPSDKKQALSNSENEKQGKPSKSPLFGRMVTAIKSPKVVVSNVLGGIASAVNFVASNNLIAAQFNQTVTQGQSSSLASTVKKSKISAEDLKMTTQKVKESSNILSSRARRRKRSMDNLWSLLRRNSKKLIGGSPRQLTPYESVWNEVLGLQVKSSPTSEPFLIRPYGAWVDNFMSLWENDEMWQVLLRLEEEGEIEPITNMSQFASFILDESSLDKVLEFIDERTLDQIMDAKMELDKLLDRGIANVHFFTEEERKKCRMKIENGQIHLEDRAPKFSSRREYRLLHNLLSSYSDEAMFIVDEEGQGYMCRKERGTIQHTSLSGGKPVHTAGLISKQGNLYYLFNSSGHYCPGLAEIVKSLKFFQNSGLDINKFRVVLNDEVTGTFRIISSQKPSEYFDSLSSLLSVWNENNEEIIGLMKEFEKKSEWDKTLLDQFGLYFDSSGKVEGGKYHFYARYSFDSFVELMDKDSNFASSCLKKMCDSPHLNEEVKNKISWWKEKAD